MLSGTESKTNVMRIIFWRGAEEQRMDKCGFIITAWKSRAVLTDICEDLTDEDRGLLLTLQ